MQIAIARGGVPRVHQIFHQVLKEGRGTQALLTLMDQASSGDYSPKGLVMCCVIGQWYVHLFVVLTKVY